MNRRTLIILVCVVVAAALGVAAWYLLRPQETTEEALEVVNTHPTDGAGYVIATTPYADSLIVGEWQNIANPGWHKVYYDDFDEDEGLFWGKEWDEREDVLEEDLSFHGNGWFRWEKKKNMLHEYATMDGRDVPIHREYQIQRSSTDSLVYFERDYKKNIYRFAHR